jgi:RNA ligase
VALNRIVVDYGEWDALVLLDVIDNATGKSDIAEFDAIDWPHKVEWKNLPGFDHRLIESIPEGDEGLVFYWWAPDIRVKMKAAEYVRLHRIVTGTNSRTVWEHLSEGKPITSLLDHVPDEFYQWVNDTADRMWRAFNDIDLAVGLEYQAITESISWDDVGGLPDALMRKEWQRAYAKLFAAKAKSSEYVDILFAQLNGKPWRHLVWKRLKPSYERPFSNQTEDVN